ncbi:MAG: DUF5777 family beta-barrel protein [Bacteroidota bacterium]
MRTLLIFCLLAIPFCLLAQDKNFASQTFKSTRIINTHSVETIPKRKLDFRVTHRFGDIAGDFGGFQTLYGLENAADILIAFEYGITDDLMVGIGRTKGAGPIRQLIHGFVKYRALKQTEGPGFPISVTLVAGTTLSTMKKSETPDLLTSFEKFSHRQVHNGQVLVARKFSPWLSLQAQGIVVHRNLVDFDDTNTLVSAGVSARVQLNKVFAAIIDSNYTLDANRTPDNDFYFPLGVGLEIDTGGHVFQLNLTNTQGISEADWVPYTQSNWLDGQYRLGFTISRLFNL